MVRPDTDPVGLVLQTGRHGVDAEHYDRIWVPLLGSLGRRGSVSGALVAALAEVGSPTVHRSCADRPALR